MKNLFPFFALLLVVVASSFTLPTVTPEAPEAAVDYFLKLDGIDGESTAKGHEKWIELESVALNRTSKTITIVRPKTSKSSALLQLACAQGQHFKKAILHVRKAGGDGTYLKYELENVLISNYSISGASSDRPMESLSINFTKIEYK